MTREYESNSAKQRNTVAGVRSIRCVYTRKYIFMDVPCVCVCVVRFCFVYFGGTPLPQEIDIIASILASDSARQT